MQKKNAFTLAEVLITLGIIGVVAAMTLPTLVQNNQNKELQTGVKKAYSVLGQALNMYQAEYGERITSQNTDVHTLKPALKKYLKVVKDCGLGFDDAEKACIKNFGDAEKDSTTYKNFTGSNSINLTYFDDGQLILPDGSFILIENQIIGKIYLIVDVNGYLKRPNRLGKDLFMFQIDSKGVLRPMGTEGTDYYDKNDKYCSSTSNDKMNGAGCTYKALIDDDFWKNLP